MRRKNVVRVLEFLILLFAGICGTADAQAQGSGQVPEALYLQPVTGSCSECGEPLFAREGDWAEDTRCYGCWAEQRDRYSYVDWIMPAPYCIHCGISTLGNTSGYCDTCIMAACGEHTLSVKIVDEESQAPVEGVQVRGGVFSGETDGTGIVTVTVPDFHLDGMITIYAVRDGYQSGEQEASALALTDTVVVELSRVPDEFRVPIAAAEFLGEAFGPVAADLEESASFLTFPLRVGDLLPETVILQRDPETGYYAGTLKMDGFVQMLFDGVIDLSGEIQAFWDGETGRLELRSADVEASVELSGNLGGVIAGVEGELVPSIRLLGVQENGQLKLIPIVNCSGMAYAYLGAKLGTTFRLGRLEAELEAEATGGVRFDLTAELANGVSVFEDFVRLNGHLRTQIKLLGFERSWEGFHWQYYPVIEEDPVIPDPVVRFLGRDETGTAQEGSQEFHPDAALSQDGTPVVEESGSSADPCIVPSGSGGFDASGVYTGQTTLFWLADDSEREEMNRYMLVSSVYEDGGWSSPLPVLDDGTADYAPRAAAVEDTVYLLWQNSDREFSAGTVPEEYAQSMDIYAAVLKNGEVQSITNLSEGIEGYCGMQTLSVQDGVVSACWVSNDSGDLLFQNGENRGYEAVYRDDAWEISESEILSASGEWEEEFLLRTAGFGMPAVNPPADRSGDSEEENGIPDSAEVVSNGTLEFLYWTQAEEEGNVRLDGVFRNPETGAYGEVGTYLQNGTMLHGIHAAMDSEGTVLMTCLSSEWLDREAGTYAENDLLAIAIPVPDEAADFLNASAEADDMESEEQQASSKGWVVPIICVVVAAAGGAAGVIMRKRKQRNQ